MFMPSVVVTGLGVVSPLGNDIETFCSNLHQGKSGIVKFSSFDSTKFEHHHAGEVSGYPKDVYEEKGRTIGKVSRFAIDAARQALADARLDLSATPPHSVAIVIGSTIAGGRIFEELGAVLEQQGADKVEVALMPEITGYSLSANLSYALNHSGISLSALNACAAGSTAIIYATELLSQHVVDYAIAGGADVLSKITLAGFSQMRAIDQICRPFDKNRTGIVVSEGSGIVILERRETARKRDCHIYGEVLGYGMTSDGTHPTAPNPEGLYMAKAVQKALQGAALPADKIGYICAHGTGTPANDVAETKGIKKALGEAAYKIPVSSIKSMLGHTMGASSAIAAISSLLAINRGFIPPTINYRTPDPACDLDYVPNISRQQEINTCMVNAFAFGGMNTVLVLGKGVQQ
jgi:3-oxoacyl-[acyl-carrier-protein] synthase II